MPQEISVVWECYTRTQEGERGIPDRAPLSTSMPEGRRAVTPHPYADIYATIDAEGAAPRAASRGPGPQPDLGSRNSHANEGRSEDEPRSKAGGRCRGTPERRVAVKALQAAEGSDFPGVRILFVGINPGIRSAEIGHHFAGYSNRFWKLLHESGLVPERIGPYEDGRLPEWGLGLTNLVARPTAGIDDLRPEEFPAGRRALVAKVRRFRPAVVALTGVTLVRAVLPGLQIPPRVGPQREDLEGARVFVLPNPSGRNANYSYAEMLAAFHALKRYASELEA